MDRPSSPELELCVDDLPDLNVNSYYGQNNPLVQRDCGNYTYNETSDSYGSSNGDSFDGIANLSDETRDLSSITSSLSKKGESCDRFCGDIDSSKNLENFLESYSYPASGSDIEGSKQDTPQDDSTSVASTSECCCDRCISILSGSRSPSSESSLDSVSSFDSETGEPSINSILRSFTKGELILTDPLKLYRVYSIEIIFPSFSNDAYVPHESTGKLIIKSEHQPKIEKNEVVMSGRDINERLQQSRKNLMMYPDQLVFLDEPGPSAVTPCPPVQYQSDSAYDETMPLGIQDTDDNSAMFSDILQYPDLTNVFMGKDQNTLIRDFIMMPSAPTSASNHVNSMNETVITCRNTEGFEEECPSGEIFYSKFAASLQNLPSDDNAELDSLFEQLPHDILSNQQQYMGEYNSNYVGDLGQQGLVVVREGDSQYYQDPDNTLNGSLGCNQTLNTAMINQIDPAGTVAVGSGASYARVIALPAVDNLLLADATPVSNLTLVTAPSSSSTVPFQDTYILSTDAKDANKTNRPCLKIVTCKIPDKKSDLSGSSVKSISTQEDKSNQAVDEMIEIAKMDSNKDLVEVLGSLGQQSRDCIQFFTPKLNPSPQQSNTMPNLIAAAPNIIRPDPSLPSKSADLGVVNADLMSVKPIISKKRSPQSKNTLVNKPVKLTDDPKIIVQLDKNTIKLNSNVQIVTKQAQNQYTSTEGNERKMGVQNVKKIDTPNGPRFEMQSTHRKVTIPMTEIKKGLIRSKSTSEVCRKDKNSVVISEKPGKSVTGFAKVPPDLSVKQNLLNKRRGSLADAPRSVDSSTSTDAEKIESRTVGKNILGSILDSVRLSEKDHKPLVNASSKEGSVVISLPNSVNNQSIKSYTVKPSIRSPASSKPEEKTSIIRRRVFKDHSKEPVKTNTTEVHDVYTFDDTNSDANSPLETSIFHRNNRMPRRFIDSTLGAAIDPKFNTNSAPSKPASSLIRASTVQSPKSTDKKPVASKPVAKSPIKMPPEGQIEKKVVRRINGKTQESPKTILVSNVPSNKAKVQSANTEAGKKVSSQSPDGSLKDVLLPSKLTPIDVQKKVGSAVVNKSQDGALTEKPSKSRDSSRGSLNKPLPDKGPTTMPTAKAVESLEKKVTIESTDKLKPRNKSEVKTVQSESNIQESSGKKSVEMQTISQSAVAQLRSEGGTKSKPVCKNDKASSDVPSTSPKDQVKPSENKIPSESIEVSKETGTDSPLKSAHSQKESASKKNVKDSVKVVSELKQTSKSKAAAAPKIIEKLSEGVETISEKSEQRKSKTAEAIKAVAETSKPSQPVLSIHDSGNSETPKVSLEQNVLPVPTISVDSKCTEIVSQPLLTVDENVVENSTPEPKLKTSDAADKPDKSQIRSKKPVEKCTDSSRTVPTDSKQSPITDQKASTRKDSLRNASHAIAEKTSGSDKPELKPSESPRAAAKKIADIDKSKKKIMENKAACPPKKEPPKNNDEPKSLEFSIEKLTAKDEKKASELGKDDGKKNKASSESTKPVEVKSSSNSENESVGSYKAKKLQETKGISNKNGRSITIEKGGSNRSTKSQKLEAMAEPAVSEKELEAAVCSTGNLSTPLLEKSEMSDLKKYPINRSKSLPCANDSVRIENSSNVASELFRSQPDVTKISGEVDVTSISDSATHVVPSDLMSLNAKRQAPLGKSINGASLPVEEPDNDVKSKKNALPSAGVIPKGLTLNKTPEKTTVHTVEALLSKKNKPVVRPVIYEPVIDPSMPVLVPAVPVNSSDESSVENVNKGKVKRNGSSGKHSSNLSISKSDALCESLTTDNIDPLMPKLTSDIEEPCNHLEEVSSFSNLTSSDKVLPPDSLNEQLKEPDSDKVLTPRDIPPNQAITSVTNKSILPDSTDFPNKDNLSEKGDVTNFSPSKKNDEKVKLADSLKKKSASSINPVPFSSPLKNATSLDIGKENKSIHDDSVTSDSLVVTEISQDVSSICDSSNSLACPNSPLITPSVNPEAVSDSRRLVPITNGPITDIHAEDPGIAELTINGTRERPSRKAKKKDIPKKNKAKQVPEIISSRETPQDFDKALEDPAYNQLLNLELVKTDPETKSNNSPESNSSENCEEVSQEKLEQIVTSFLLQNCRDKNARNNLQPEGSFNENIPSEPLEDVSLPPVKIENSSSKAPKTPVSVKDYRDTIIPEKDVDHEEKEPMSSRKCSLRSQNAKNQKPSASASSTTNSRTPSMNLRSSSSNGIDKDSKSPRENDNPSTSSCNGLLGPMPKTIRFVIEPNNMAATDCSAEIHGRKGETVNDIPGSYFQITIKEPPETSVDERRSSRRKTSNPTKIVQGKGVESTANLDFALQEAVHEFSNLPAESEAVVPDKSMIASNNIDVGLTVANGPEVTEKSLQVACEKHIPIAAAPITVNTAHTSTRVRGLRSSSEGTSNTSVAVNDSTNSTNVSPRSSRAVSTPEVNQIVSPDLTTPAVSKSPIRKSSKERKQSSDSKVKKTESSVIKPISKSSKAKDKEPDTKRNDAKSPRRKDDTNLSPGPSKQRSSPSDGRTCEPKKKPEVEKNKRISSETISNGEDKHKSDGKVKGDDIENVTVDPLSHKKSSKPIKKKSKKHEINTEVSNLEESGEDSDKGDDKICRKNEEKRKKDQAKQNKKEDKHKKDELQNRGRQNNEEAPRKRDDEKVKNVDERQNRRDHDKLNVRDKTKDFESVKPKDNESVKVKDQPRRKDDEKGRKEEKGKLRRDSSSEDTRSGLRSASKKLEEQHSSVSSKKSDLKSPPPKAKSSKTSNDLLSPSQIDSAPECVDDSSKRDLRPVVKPVTKAGTNIPVKSKSQVMKSKSLKDLSDSGDIHEPLLRSRSESKILSPDRDSKNRKKHSPIRDTKATEKTEKSRHHKSDKGNLPESGLSTSTSSLPDLPSKASSLRGSSLQLPKTSSKAKRSKSPTKSSKIFQDGKKSKSESKDINKLESESPESHILTRKETSSKRGLDIELRRGHSSPEMTHKRSLTPTKGTKLAAPKSPLPSSSKSTLSKLSKGGNSPKVVTSNSSKSDSDITCPVTPLPKGAAKALSSKAEISTENSTEPKEKSSTMQKPDETKNKGKITETPLPGPKPPFEKVAKKLTPTNSSPSSVSKKVDPPCILDKPIKALSSPDMEDMKKNKRSADVIDIRKQQHPPKKRYKCADIEACLAVEPPPKLLPITRKQRLLSGSLENKPVMSPPRVTRSSQREPLSPPQLIREDLRSPRSPRASTSIESPLSPNVRRTPRVSGVPSPVEPDVAPPYSPLSGTDKKQDQFSEPVNSPVTRSQTRLTPSPSTPQHHALDLTQARMSLSPTPVPVDFAEEHSDHKDDEPASDSSKMTSSVPSPSGRSLRRRVRDKFVGVSASTTLDSGHKNDESSAEPVTDTKDLPESDPREQASLQDFISLISEDNSKSSGEKDKINTTHTEEGLQKENVELASNPCDIISRELTHIEEASVEIPCDKSSDGKPKEDISLSLLIEADKEEVRKKSDIGNVSSNDSESGYEKITNKDEPEYPAQEIAPQVLPLSDVKSLEKSVPEESLAEHQEVHNVEFNSVAETSMIDLKDQEISENQKEPEIPEMNNVAALPDNSSKITIERTVTPELKNATLDQTINMQPSSEPLPSLTTMVEDSTRQEFSEKESSCENQNYNEFFESNSLNLEVTKPSVDHQELKMRSNDIEKPLEENSNEKLQELASEVSKVTEDLPENCIDSIAEKSNLGDEETRAEIKTNELMESPSEVALGNKEESVKEKNMVNSQTPSTNINADASTKDDLENPQIILAEVADATKITEAPVNAELLSLLEDNDKAMPGETISHKNIPELLPAENEYVEKSLDDQLIAPKDVSDSIEVNLTQSTSNIEFSEIQSVTKKEIPSSLSVEGKPQDTEIVQNLNATSVPDVQIISLDITNNDKNETTDLEQIEELTKVHEVKSDNVIEHVGGDQDSKLEGNLASVTEENTSSLLQEASLVLPSGEELALIQGSVSNSEAFPQTQQSNSILPTDSDLSKTDEDNPFSSSKEKSSVLDEDDKDETSSVESFPRRAASDFEFDDDEYSGLLYSGISVYPPAYKRLKLIRPEKPNIESDTPKSSDPETNSEKQSSINEDAVSKQNTTFHRKVIMVIDGVEIYDCFVQLEDFQLDANAFSSLREPAKSTKKSENIYAKSYSSRKRGPRSKQSDSPDKTENTTLGKMRRRKRKPSVTELDETEEIKKPRSNSSAKKLKISTEDAENTKDKKNLDSAPEDQNSSPSVKYSHSKSSAEKEDSKLESARAKNITKIRRSSNSNGDTSVPSTNVGNLNVNPERNDDAVLDSEEKSTSTFLNSSSESSVSRNNRMDVDNAYFYDGPSCSHHTPRVQQTSVNPSSIPDLCVQTQRVSLRGLMQLMRAHQLTTVFVPVYFLHLITGQSLVDSSHPLSRYTAQIVDTGGNIAKVITRSPYSGKQEIFYLTSDGLKLEHESLREPISASESQRRHFSSSPPTPPECDQNGSPVIANLRASQDVACSLLVNTPEASENDEDKTSVNSGQLCAYTNAVMDLVTDNAIKKLDFQPSTDFIVESLHDIRRDEPGTSEMCGYSFPKTDRVIVFPSDGRISPIETEAVGDGDVRTRVYVMKKSPPPLPSPSIKNIMKKRKVNQAAPEPGPSESKIPMVEEMAEPEENFIEVIDEDSPAPVERQPIMADLLNAIVARRTSNVRAVPVLLEEAHQVGVKTSAGHSLNYQLLYPPNRLVCMVQVEIWSLS